MFELGEYDGNGCLQLGGGKNGEQLRELRRVVCGRLQMYVRFMGVNVLEYDQSRRKW